MGTTFQVLDSENYQISEYLPAEKSLLKFPDFLGFNDKLRNTQVPDTITDNYAFDFNSHIKELRTHLTQLSTLPANWDGYGAEPISPQVIQHIRNLLTLLPKAYITPLTPDNLTPTVYGTVVIDWYLDDEDEAVISLDIWADSANFYVQPPGDTAEPLFFNDVPAENLHQHPYLLQALNRYIHLSS